MADLLSLAARIIDSGDADEPTNRVTQELALTVGGLDIELHHGRGETDDHTWAWIPRHRAIACGDFLIWNFPNAGNPQKVQRYPGEWAAALRQMAALEPDLLLPAHGLPDRWGRPHPHRARDGRRHAGMHTVTVPDDVLALPYRPPTPRTGRSTPVGAASTSSAAPQRRR